MKTLLERHTEAFDSSASPSTSYFYLELFDRFLRQTLKIDGAYLMFRPVFLKSIYNGMHFRNVYIDKNSGIRLQNSLIVPSTAKTAIDAVIINRNTELFRLCNDKTRMIRAIAKANIIGRGLQVGTKANIYPMAVFVGLAYFMSVVLFCMIMLLTKMFLPTIFTSLSITLIVGSIFSFINVLNLKSTLL